MIIHYAPERDPSSASQLSRKAVCGATVVDATSTAGLVTCEACLKELRLQREDAEVFAESQWGPSVTDIRDAELRMARARRRATSRRRF